MYLYYFTLLYYLIDNRVHRSSLLVIVYCLQNWQETAWSYTVGSKAIREYVSLVVFFIFHLGVILCHCDLRTLSLLIRNTRCFYHRVCHSSDFCGQLISHIVNFYILHEFVCLNMWVGHKHLGILGKQFLPFQSA